MNTKPRTYRGCRSEGSVLVSVNGKPLSPARSLRAFNHSPTGFEWGYGGSGPAQLALALLLDVTNVIPLAIRLHQDFKWSVVCKWGADWTITAEEIAGWVVAKCGSDYNWEALTYDS